MIPDRRDRIVEVELVRLAGLARVQVVVPYDAEPEAAVEAAVARAGDPDVVAAFDADEAAHGRAVTDRGTRFVGRVESRAGGTA